MGKTHNVDYYDGQMMKPSGKPVERLHIGTVQLSYTGNYNDKKLRTIG